MIENASYTYIDQVESLTPWGMKSGRDTLLKLLSYIWSPQNTLKVFHITGSNGKWSVCIMLAQVLSKKFNKKVGLFTSPHLIDITERFQVNGAPISPTELDKYYEKVLALGQKYQLELSFFEIQVVTMILYFSEQKVDYAVVEVGLGWVYDGTNIFSHPLACFITSISLEHTQILGKTRKSILKNKLWIAKNGTELYTFIKNKQIKTYCDNHHVTLNNTFKINQTLTNLPGHHQQKNAYLVLQSLLDLWFDEEDIRQWLKNIYNSWRFDWITPHILVDTANNTENLRLLQKMINKEHLNNVTLIFWTTQTNSEKVRELLKIFPHQKWIFVDGFCDRALPCSLYAVESWVESHFLHLDTQSWKKEMLSILEMNKNAEKYLIFWSLYLVWYVMKLSRYNIFAN